MTVSDTTLDTTSETPDTILLDLPVSAGSEEANAFDWAENWYPVFYLDDLDRETPQRFTLLDRDLVIWWDGEDWRAFADRCPHRLAPLSEGRIADGLLECPYHGWGFAGDGQCERLPQEPPEIAARSSSRACATAYATAVRQGLLFVYAGKLENADADAVPTVPVLNEDAEDADEWICMNTFRDLPYDATTLLENVLDVSHIPYTHHQTVGNRKYAAPVGLELVSFGRQGFTGKWEEGPRKGALGRQDTTFIAPGLMWHDLTSEQFGRTLTVVYATPICKGECRLFARFPFKFASKIPKLAISLTPRWYSHVGNNNVLEDDQIFLHWQERYLERLSADADGGASDRAYARACYLPTAADRFVLAYHKWLAQFGHPFPGQPLPPAQTQVQLLDRYHSHTKHCKSCSGALTRIQQLRRIVGGLGLVAIASIPAIAASDVSTGAAIGFAVLTVAIGAAFWAIGRFERRFFEGSYPPPRNAPEKPAKASDS